MTIDLDTFLTVVYCITSDLYQQLYAPQKPKRRGRRAELSDEEVVTLAILAQWQERRSEREFGRYVANHWRSYFPRLLSQSQLNRRMRDIAGMLSALGPQVAWQLSAQLGAPSYEVLDGVPMPLMRRCRGDRHRCFANEAAIGRGGSDRDFYYGVKVLMAVNSHGLVTGFVFGPANTEERWLGEALLRWRTFPHALPPCVEDLAEVLPRDHPNRGGRRGPSAPILPATGVGQATAPCYLADLGYQGQSWQEHWRLDYQAIVLTEGLFDGQADEDKLDRQLHSLRQVIESTYNLFTNCLGLSFPRARTFWGLLMRLSAKIAACNMMLWFNHLLGRPTYAQISPFAL
jgi:hypothetical protein